MKHLKKILIWILVSLSLQLVGLFYINNYYLSNNVSDIKAKKVENKKPEPKKTIDISVPQNAKHVNLSYDGKYLSYYDGDILDVVNTDNGEIQKVNFEDGVKISFYRWLNDRNRMLIAEKVPTKNNEITLKLSYYDVDRKEKVEIKDLASIDKKSEVVDIKASTLTNVKYIKVAHSGNRSSIYWLNIMEDMKKIETKSYLIGNIEVIPHEDKLVYEDLTYNKIHVTNVKNPITINGANKLSLISVDSEDVIYLAEMDGDKVKKIHYGTLKDSTEKWSVSEINSETVTLGDVYVSLDGKIFINDNLKGIVKELSSGKEVSYEGKFLHMYNGGIASIKGGKLIKTKF